MHKRLPPLKALVAFESVVRTGSVTSAAEELFVTHSAVSKQVGTLESWVGQPLFADNRRTMAPTHAAQQLADTVGMALNLISKALDNFFDKEGEQRLEVIAPATFAMRWLLPRLPEFQMQHRSIRIQVRQTHTPDNWSQIPFDVAIRRGGAAPSGFRSMTFLREELGLVCGSQFLATNEGQLPALEQIPLLNVDTRPGELEAWLIAAGASARLATTAPTFPHFYIALEAALAGQGALVAPVTLLTEVLRRRDLIEVIPAVRVPGRDYVALYPEGAGPDAPESRFTSWLASLTSTELESAGSRQ